MCGGAPSEQVLDLAWGLRTIADDYLDAEGGDYVEDRAELGAGLASFQSRYCSLAQMDLSSKLGLSQTGAAAVATDGRTKLFWGSNNLVHSACLYCIAYCVSIYYIEYKITPYLIAYILSMKAFAAAEKSRSGQRATSTTSRCSLLSASRKCRFMLSALARNQIDVSVGKSWTRAFTEHRGKLELG